MNRSMPFNTFVAEINNEYHELLNDINVTVVSGFAKLLPLRLHISNIPFCYTEDHLRKLLEKYGTVLEVEIITNQRGSKGFGFGTMEKQIDAERAIRELNGTLIHGRQIEVNLATKRKFNEKSESKRVRSLSLTMPSISFSNPSFSSSMQSLDSPSLINFNQSSSPMQPSFYNLHKFFSSPSTPSYIKNVFNFSPN